MAKDYTKNAERTITVSDHENAVNQVKEQMKFDHEEVKGQIKIDHEEVKGQMKDDHEKVREQMEIDYENIIEKNKTETTAVVKRAKLQGRFEERKYITRASESRKKRRELGESGRDPFYAQHFENRVGISINGDALEKQYPDKKVREIVCKVIEADTGGWTIITGGSGLGYKRALSPDELFLRQTIIFERFQRDPHMQAIVNNITWYCIGKGTRIDCPVPEIKQLLEDFRKRNQMPLREKQMIKTGFMDGEYYPYYILNSKGDVLMRRIPPHEIKDIEHGGDVDSPLAYQRTYRKAANDSSLADAWYPDIFYYDQLKGDWKRNSGFIKKREKRAREFVQQIAYKEEGEIRGRPPLFSILRYLKYVEDLIEDRMILNHERAKVVWVRTDPNDESDGQNNFEAPRGGLILEETAGVTYRVMAAKLESQDSKVDLDSVLMTIGAFRNIPLFILHQDPSNSNYASIKKSDTPFVQMIESEQDFWAEHWENMYRFVIHMKKLHGGLKDTYEVPEYSQRVVEQVSRYINISVVGMVSEEEILKEVKSMLGKPKMVTINAEDAPITQIFPQIANQDPLAMAKVMQIHQKMGILSQATAASLSGYDWKAELGNLTSERDSGADEFKEDNVPEMDIDEADHGSTDPEGLDRKGDKDGGKPDA